MVRSDELTRFTDDLAKSFQNTFFNRWRQIDGTEDSRNKVYHMAREA